ncbi:hypothetical protein [Actinoplanes sp. NBRC 101535]|uniref:hypothetical protein n=1 Tax=Actinoplanes sp. NBRC 101535 TaxID=3032196 RepID=UPI00249FE547|nr:hypothetical protein [Actinoplanes sp. NBRC 101535]GLY02353.1 hypothetical protein Acsp01_27320 [Actinoplanes sp. NBRC 101535]
MADLVVKDLADLSSTLKALVAQFQGALGLEEEFRDEWGQANANQSMSVFADNWTHNRYNLEEDMGGYADKVAEVDKAWAEAETDLANSMESQ